MVTPAYPLAINSALAVSMILDWTSKALACRLVESYFRLEFSGDISLDTLVTLFYHQFGYSNTLSKLTGALETIVTGF